MIPRTAIALFALAAIIFGVETLRLFGPGGLAALLAVLLAAAFYFGPTIRAYKDRKRDTAAIAALNLLLGWTFVGWVVALVWALRREPGDGPARW